MPKHKFIAVLVIFAVFGMVTGLVAKAPPRKVVIKDCQKKKPPVAFDHEKHAKTLKIGCKSCHHKGSGKKCVSCHAGKMKGKTPGCAEMSLKKNPYHITCAGCHKKKGKGPKSCGKCHKK